MPFAAPFPLAPESDHRRRVTSALHRGDFSLFQTGLPCHQFLLEFIHSSILGDASPKIFGFVRGKTNALSDSPKPVIDAPAQLAPGRHLLWSIDYKAKHPFIDGRSDI